MFLLSVCGDLRPQTAVYLHHQVWGTEDGLPQATVHAILQDREGFLWIATEGGVARFDGLGFQAFRRGNVPEMLTDDATALLEDRSGDLWIGTANGLLRRRNGNFQRYSQRDGLPSDDIRGLTSKGSSVLVDTGSGPAFWDGNRFRPAPGTIFPKVVTSSGTEGPWTFDSTAVQHTRSWHAGRELPGSRVQAVFVDAHGTAWVGTNRGLASIDADNQIQVQPDLRGESVLSLAGDREGDLWIGTEASGLHVLRPQKFTTMPDAKQDAVTSLLRASDGKMYFGTKDSGLFRMGATVAAVGYDRLTSPVILSLAAGRNADIWAGTPDGLNHIQGAGAGAQLERWTIAEGLPDNFVRSTLVENGGTVWAGTRLGLIRIEGKSIRTYTTADGLASNSIGPLLQVGTATLWIGTSAGLCRRDADRFHCLTSPAEMQGSVTALGIIPPGVDGSHSVWVAIHGHGLGLAGERELTPLHSDAIPKEITGILADTAGSLWLRSPQGLFRLAVEALGRCASDRQTCSHLAVESFGRMDGMPSEELAGAGTPSMILGTAGQLFFATRRGIAVTDSTHLHPTGVPPGIAITGFQVDGVDAANTIGAGHHHLALEYTGLNLNQPAGLRYRYMLQGFDHDWIDAGTRRTAFYTNLPPRKYVFQVVSVNRDGTFSASPATIDFRVLAPWYRTIWAYLAAVLLAGALVYGWTLLRLRAAGNRYELLLGERARVAREVHDTLAQDLVSVSLQLEISSLHAKSGRLAETAEQLAQTKLLVRQALESARQSIWNLRSNLAAQSLPMRLAARLQEYRKAHGAADLRVTGEYRPLHARTEDEIMRIAGEAIGNAGRHAQASHLSVQLCYSRVELELTVYDNGLGFDLATARAKAGHYGLRGLEERASVLRGRLRVESGAETGTVVTLAVPLTETK